MKSLKKCAIVAACILSALALLTTTMLTLDQVRKQSGDYDAGRIQILRLCSMGLQSLSVLIACKDLTSLDISQNTIMDISPLSRLTSLRVLVANDNKIRSLLPLQKLGLLRDLRISNNAFSSWEAVVEQCCEFQHLKRLDLVPLQQEIPRAYGLSFT
jgi:Leucine-rich repeat (LRR) protein